MKPPSRFRCQPAKAVVPSNAMNAKSRTNVSSRVYHFAASCEVCVYDRNGEKTIRKTLQDRLRWSRVAGPKNRRSARTQARR